MKGRILVIRGGALGDFILTLPVLAALREHFPGAGLDLIGYPQYARLAQAAGLVDAVRPIEGRALAGFFARDGALDDDTARHLGGFAVIFSYLYDPDGIFQSNVARCSRAQFIAAPHRPDETRTEHAVDVFLGPLQRLAIYRQGAAPRLPLAPRPPGPGSWIAFHPGSGSASKNWPETRWAELLERVITGTDSRVLLTGGEAEGTRLERLAAVAAPERVRTARSLPLDELASLLAGCRHFVGHDSGVTHLASALGVPSTVLWGPSQHALWHPRGPGTEVIAAPGGRLDALSTDHVWTRLQERLTLVPHPGPAADRHPNPPCPPP